MNSCDRLSGYENSFVFLDLVFLGRPSKLSVLNSVS